MASRNTIDHTGRSAVGVIVPAGVKVKCPRCGAAIGSRCFSLASWTEIPGHPDGGFYTKRIEKPHAERTAGRCKRPALSERGAMRREISDLAQTKLTGTQRREVRGWAGSTRTTDEQLAAKVAELKAMPDLAW